MARAPWAASPILQAIWATCSHDDYEDHCPACGFRLEALKEYANDLRR